MSRLLRPRVILPAALLVGFVVYLLLGLALVVMSTRPGERKPFEAMPGDFGLAYEDVTFPPRGEDLKLSGWLIPGQPGAPFLVFVHGIDSQRTNSGTVELASRLVRDAGYNVLMFDLRAHGTSEGDQTTAGDRERYDALGAYDYAVSRGAEPGRVALVGQSYGAGISIMAASLEPGIVAVVADSSFSSVEDKAAHEVALRTPIPKWAVPALMPPARLFAKLLYDVDLSHLSPAQDVAKLGYPVLLIHGEADTRTPAWQSRRIYEAAPEGSELWTLPGVEHTQAFRARPDEYVARVEAYLALRLAGRLSLAAAGTP